MSSLSSLSFGVSSSVPRSDAVERFTANGPATAGKAAGYGSIADSVSLSPLGEALRDESLTAFNALSDKQRSQIVSLVDSGKMTGEEVHDALKQRVKEARSSALGAMRRMFDNDNAGLYLDETTGTDDLRKALGATLDRRASLMEKLVAATDPDDRKSLSDTLSARGLNPLLSGDRSGMSRYIMAPFFEDDLGDSRMNSTRKEGDAAYKLESLGVDLGGIDDALRSVGEQDATAILSERAGLPSSRTVARDASFSLAGAIRQPFSIPLGQRDSAPGETADQLRELFRRAGAGSDATGGPVGVPRSIDMPSRSLPDFTALQTVPALQTAPVGREADSATAYLKGLRTKY